MRIPWASQKRTMPRRCTFRTFGSVLAEYAVLPWLRASGRAGFDVLDLREDEVQFPLILWSSGYGRDGQDRPSRTTRDARYWLEGFLNGGPVLWRPTISP